MPVYFCRWPNGDFSILSAPNKEEAAIRLDEFGNADRADIVQIGEFLVDFRLTEGGDFELSQFGEAAYDRIMEKGYPLLWQMKLSDALMGLNENSKKYRHLVKTAVEAERKRMRRVKKQVPQAKTERGRKLQKDHDLPAAMADQLTDQGVKEPEEIDGGNLVN